MRSYLELAREVAAGEASAETVVELACALAELGWDGPAVREAMERRTAELSAADVERLGGELTGGYRAWLAAMEVVERDMRATGVPGGLRLKAFEDGEPRVAYGDRTASWTLAFHGADPVTEVADAAQDMVAEELWTAWPVCPEHGLGLHAERGSWVCRRGHAAAPIGGLPAVEGAV
ncbi:hypothetical protein [Thermoactinospora rubra]|uniref:hypothetical protein n=1 Tax=Thermoactinospora rubra TaxID=1088767 RepID=UPI000A1225FD|nr:hypothetical protein [Thermoactinospora rubra]